jgi:hypothetical protein
MLADENARDAAAAATMRNLQTGINFHRLWEQEA